MRNLVAAALCVLAAPLSAAGLDVTVEGEGANGTFHIDLFEDVAPNHVERITTLAEEGAYDDVVFHRVIDGFMAQTGDVQFGDTEDGYDLNRAGMGGSDMPDLPAEFSDVPFKRGVVGMARAQDPNSANSQFFVMLEDGPFLNGQYTVIGEVVDGMDNVDKIKKGDQAQNGKVSDPDRILSATVSQ